MRNLHFLKIPFGFDFKFNYSDMYEYNGGQNYENHIWELLSLLDAVLDRRASLPGVNDQGRGRGAEPPRGYLGHQSRTAAWGLPQVRLQGQQGSPSGVWMVNKNSRSVKCHPIWFFGPNPLPPLTARLGLDSLYCLRCDCDTQFIMAT